MAHGLRPARRRLLGLASALIATLMRPGTAAAADAPGSTPTPPAGLPEPLRRALQAQGLPPQALHLWVQDADSGRTLRAWQAEQALNPASLFKLVTAWAALDRLGPQFRWRTPVWLDGPLREGVLQGALVIQGRGDPRWTPERLWLLVSRLRQSGLQRIAGDLVLDRQAFTVEATDPGAFDGEPLRPYNVAPDALLLAQRSVVYTFTPDVGAGLARVTVQPRLADHGVQSTVPLTDGPCGDWRGGLRATPQDTRQMRFDGRYPSACGERAWPLAWPEAASFDARLWRALWAEAGGQLDGRVRDGTAPDRAPSFVLESPPLAEVLRDIQKWSNNTLAQQLFLTLGLEQGGRGDAPTARRVLQDWLAERLGTAEAARIVVDNGSGLSRQTRISAAQLGRLLQQGWQSPLMPEWLAALPLAGIDGTAARSQGATGRAHLKTGSLADVAGVAGIVHGLDGRRRVLVAVIRHEQAGRFRAVLDAAQDWVVQYPGSP
ncbi:MAG: D-alanyl-D-alanine carboxypeptidase/D-alanyl-D-alanine-endopeptidase [Pseudomonadota bacterium]|jgi:D-alanyl-D-alanine carboxypeptidase/D-alanyl-D-alanine-endopeptidase (penicillin-binding protein 4)